MLYALVYWLLRRLIGLTPSQSRDSDVEVLVLQPQVAERYIVSTSAGDPIKALSAMTRDILSRPRLLGIIDELGLYAEEKKSLAPEEVIERMRKDVGLTPLETSPERRDINGFRISFIANDPLVAQKVTSRLTSLFVETNVKTRSDQAKSTTDFLQERLQDAKAKLDLSEKATREQWDTNTRPLAIDKVYYQDFCSLSRWAQKEKLTDQSLDFGKLTWTDGLRAIDSKLVDAPPPPC